MAEAPSREPIVDKADDLKENLDYALEALQVETSAYLEDLSDLTLNSLEEDYQIVEELARDLADLVAEKKVDEVTLRKYLVEAGFSDQIDTNAPDQPLEVDLWVKKLMQESERTDTEDEPNVESSENSQPLTKASISALLLAGDAEKTKEALLSQPLDLGTGELIKLAPLPEIEGLIDQISKGGSPADVNKAVEDWYAILKGDYSNIVMAEGLGKDLFTPKLSTLPDIVAGLVQMGHVEADKVYQAKPRETASSPGYEQRLQEFQTLNEQASGVGTLVGKPVEEIKTILETQEIKLVDNKILLDFSRLQGVEGYDDALGAFAEFLSNPGANKPKFETFLQTWMTQIKSNAPDGKIPGLPDDYVPTATNYTTLLNSLTSLSTVENSPIIQPPEKLKANPGALDFASIPDFRFNSSTIESERSKPKPEEALANLAASRLQTSLGKEYETWLDAQLAKAKKAAKEDAQEGGGASQITEKDIMGRLNGMFQSGEVDFPDEIRLVLGDELAQQFQDSALIESKGRDEMIRLVQGNIGSESLKYFKTLDQGALEDLMYENTPIQLDTKFIEDHSHLPIEDLTAMREGLDYPAKPENREKFGQLNQLILYRQLLDGVPSWATNFGEPPYSNRFAAYIRNAKNLAGNPYNSEFKPESVDATEAWNTWFENVMAKEEQGFDSIRRLFHQIVTFLKDLGFVDAEPDEKNSEERKTDFLQKHGIGETEEGKEERETQEAFDQEINRVAEKDANWTSFKLKDATPEQEFNSTDPNANNVETRETFLKANFSTIDELTNFEERFLAHSDIQEFTSETMTIDGIKDMLEGTEDIKVEGDKMTLIFDEEGESKVDIKKNDLVGATDGDTFIEEKIEEGKDAADTANKEAENERLSAELGNYSHRLSGVSIEEVRTAGLIQEGEDGEPDKLHPLFESLMSAGDADFWTTETSLMGMRGGNPVKLDETQVANFGKKVKAESVTGVDYEGEKLKVTLSSGTTMEYGSMEEYAKLL